MDIKICFTMYLSWFYYLFAVIFFVCYIQKTRFLSILCFRSQTINFGSFVVSHISTYEILEKSSHENHDDWTQLQVARAGSGRSCVSLSSRVQPSSPLFSFPIHPPPRFSFPSTGVGTRSAYVVYKPACFLAGVYTHFPPSYPPAPLRNTAATLVRVSLHPPAPKGN